MQDLIEQERFEMEVLDRLNSGRFLRHFVFCGGTMLRLCHGLDRYSVDLDFRLIREDRGSALFEEIKAYLSRFYSIKDAAEKYHTLLYELRGTTSPRSLKIEIRKHGEYLAAEQGIAYSPHSDRQVLLRVVTLEKMMDMKVEALLGRGEIRDAYDMEFLVKRGIRPPGDPKIAAGVLARLETFRKVDYTTKLGSLLEPGMRAYYLEKNFRILAGALREVLGSHGWYDGTLP